MYITVFYDISKGVVKLSYIRIYESLKLDIVQVKLRFLGSLADPGVIEILRILLLKVV